MFSFLRTLCQPKFYNIPLLKVKILAGRKTTIHRNQDSIFNIKISKIFVVFLTWKNQTANFCSVCKNRVYLVFILSIRYTKSYMTSFLKIWSKPLRCMIWYDIKTLLRNVLALVIKTKLLVLLLVLVIMLYAVMY